MGVRGWGRSRPVTSRRLDLAPLTHTPPSGRASFCCFLQHTPPSTPPSARHPLNALTHPVSPSPPARRTTSRRSLHAQVSALVSSWRWRPADRLLHSLPLHHIHGIVNALYCPAAVGAAVDFMPKFSPSAVWARLEVSG